MEWREILETAGNIASIVVALVAVGGAVWILVLRSMARISEIVRSPRVIAVYRQAAAALLPIVLIAAGAVYVETRLDLATAPIETRLEQTIPAPALSEAVVDIVDDHFSSERTPATGHGLGNDGPWGRWSDYHYCQPGHYVCGLRQKVEGRQGNGDDTALNAISFQCCPFAQPTQQPVNSE